MYSKFIKEKNNLIKFKFHNKIKKLEIKINKKIKKYKLM